MLPTQITKIESLKAQIDSGLLSLYHTEKNGYVYIDFEALITSFLSSDNITEYSATVKKYLAVFYDLIKNVGHTNIKTIAIDHKKKQLTHRETTIYFGAVPLHRKVVESSHRYDKIWESHYKKITSPNEIDEVNFHIKKWEKYSLANPNQEGGKGMHEWLFFKKYPSLFKYYGYEAFDSQYTFEKYIQELEAANDSQSQTPKDLLTHKQQILLLEELGFFELKTLQNLTNVKIGFLLSNLLNRNEKNSLDNYGNRHNRSGVKNPVNVKKIDELLKEIGIAKKL